MVNRYSQCGTHESLLRALPFVPIGHAPGGFVVGLPCLADMDRAGLYVKEAPSFIELEQCPGDLIGNLLGWLGDM
jgi:hypothetical protein